MAARKVQAPLVSTKSSSDCVDQLDGATTQPPVVVVVVAAVELAGLLAPPLDDHPPPRRAPLPPGRMRIVAPQPDA